MRKRVIITTIVSLILLFAVVLAGLNAVFTVTAVRTDFCTYSAEGGKEAVELQTKLNGYVGRSLTFLDLKDVENEVAAYPFMKVETVSKKYPDQVRIRIVEKKESYAYLLPDGSFAALDENGEYLRSNPTLDNRVAGKNIPLVDFGFRLVDGKTEGRYFEPLMDCFACLRDALGEVRANVVSVSLNFGGGESAPETHYFRFTRREGVVIDLYNPQREAAAKMRSAADLYTGQGTFAGKGLNDAEKTGGIVTVNLVGDKIVCAYQAETNE